MKREDAMHLIELRADNFKRLRAVRLETKDRMLVEVVGRNAQGKSSVLDAIWAALGGERAAPDKPIRDGATRAEVFIDLGDIKVTRRWTNNERSSLVVESKDGAKVRSPQAVLDALVGRLSFDPLDFARMDTRAQAQSLRQIAGLDFADLDERRARAYEARTAVNREVKNLQTKADMVQVPPDAPDAEVAAKDILERHTKALRQIEDNQKKRRRAQEAADKKAAAEAHWQKLQEQLLQAQKAIAAAESEIIASIDGVFGLVDPDLESILRELRDSEARNAAARNKKARRSIEAELHAAETEVRRLEREMEDVDEQRRRRLSEAKFPIDGLSVEGEAVTFRDQPFKQASTAEQIRVGLAIGAALNPRLRVILVREGSSLDAEALRELAAWAEENRVQVFLERVASDADGTGVLIEDGEVREKKSTPAPTPSSTYTF